MEIKPYTGKDEPFKTNTYIIETRDIKKMVIDENNITTAIVLKRKYGDRKRQFIKI